MDFDWRWKMLCHLYVQIIFLKISCEIKSKPSFVLNTDTLTRNKLQAKEGLIEVAKRKQNRNHEQMQ